VKKDKGKSSNAKISFGKRREGKHSKSNGPKDRKEKKKYRGQG
jgi:hypothetical protein